MSRGQDIDYSNILPEDVLKEVLEEERRVRGRKKRENLPSTRDIVEAVIQAASLARGIHPHEFPDLVYRILKEQGFSTKYVTIKRIWRTYESLVIRGVINDVLDVVGKR